MESNQRYIHNTPIIEQKTPASKPHFLSTTQNRFPFLRNINQLYQPNRLIQLIQLNLPLNELFSILSGAFFVALSGFMCSSSFS
jgi:hypothetical protein